MSSNHKILEEAIQPWACKLFRNAIANALTGPEARERRSTRDTGTLNDIKAREAMAMLGLVLINLFCNHPAASHTSEA
jgi:hypothetical protein